MNTINDRIAFCAKLDYKNVDGSDARWSKIAKDFENKTKQYPNDTFCLETSDEGEIYFSPNYSGKKLRKITGSNDKGVISVGTTNLLETFSSAKVAGILERLFLIRKEADNMLVDYYNFENKYDLTNKVEDAIDSFYMKFHGIRNLYVENALKKDPVLNKLGKIDVI